jgi:adenosylcobinamide kinase/adenosylcobinamide-phosphate guanylyltransferase
MSLPKLSLVLGGAASGKSAWAEALVNSAGLQKLYLATAQVYDVEMEQKVARHRQTRGDGWTTIEEPLALGALLDRMTDNQIVLLDCATLWLTNVMLADLDVAKACEELVEQLQRCAAPVVVVSNEVGQGIVPDNALSRRFRNAQGALNQSIAAHAELVVVVMAGLPLALKGKLP